ncbi:hypothetical protein BGW80DRAFT_1337848 [Lactifluus volemus]|nr:hypothetical protein BGW80DRAFT_1337848 [Lactifluus volemus]
MLYSTIIVFMWPAPSQALLRVATKPRLRARAKGITQLPSSLTTTTKLPIPSVSLSDNRAVLFVSPIIPAEGGLYVKNLVCPVGSLTRHVPVIRGG